MPRGAFSVLSNLAFDLVNPLDLQHASTGRAICQAPSLVLADGLHLLFHGNLQLSRFLPLIGLHVRRERLVSNKAHRASVLDSRGYHGYIPEDYIRALHPYPLRIRSGNAYPKCSMKKGGEDISIVSDRNCEIISYPYPRYEIQDTGIYTVKRLPASG